MMQARFNKQRDHAMVEARDLEITSPLDDFRFTAVRATPQGERKGGVVVIQEIFGVSPHIREICGFYADHGYEAVAPSLYDRIEKNFRVTELNDAGLAKGIRAATTTPPDQVVADLQASIAALGAGPIYVTGFCYGGAMSWLAAARCTGLKAASGFYGGMIFSMLEQAPKIPIILHFGREDPHIPMTAVDKIKAAAPDVPVYLYDAGHGFCRRNSTDFHEASCNLALQTTLDFFEANR